MYKTLSFEDLTKIKTSFFSNLKNIYEKEWYAYFKQFLKKINDGLTKELMFCSSWEIYFRICFNEKVEIIDEKQSIRLILDEETIDKLHNYLKKKTINLGKKNIANTLLDVFNTTNMKEILGKHFIVYDIETIWNIQNLQQTKFMIAYAIDSSDYEKTGQAPKYKYVDRKRLDKFVQYLLDYDWYIIGYNHISFDNPVIVYNSSFKNKEEIIEKLNSKSIDLFYIYSKLLGKKVWLNQVATGLVGVSKTLSSGAEGASLLKAYEDTGDKQALEKVKKYCKNDVKMTLTILLYLLLNWNISVWWKDVTVSPLDLIKWGTISSWCDIQKNNLFN